MQGKFYFRIDPLGEGAKWRRSFGQEIYSPLLLAFSEQVRERPLSDLSAVNMISPGTWFCKMLQDGDGWRDIEVPTFTGIDPSYCLPDNVALITLQVIYGIEIYGTLLKSSLCCYASVYLNQLNSNLIFSSLDSQNCRNLLTEKFYSGWLIYTRFFPMNIVTL